MVLHATHSCGFLAMINIDTDMDFTITHCPECGNIVEDQQDREFNLEVNERYDSIEYEVLSELLEQKRIKKSDLSYRQKLLLKPDKNMEVL